MLASRFASPLWPLARSTTTAPDACPVAGSKRIVPCLNAKVPFTVCSVAPSVNATVECAGSSSSDRVSARAASGRAVATKQKTDRTTGASIRSDIISPAQQHELGAEAGPHCAQHPVRPRRRASVLHHGIEDRDHRRRREISHL